jgi:hypothetical protein
MSGLIALRTATPDDLDALLAFFARPPRASIAQHGHAPVAGRRSPKNVNMRVRCPPIVPLPR